MKTKSLKIIDNVQLVAYCLFLFLWFISSEQRTLRVISVVVFTLFLIIQITNIIRRKKLLFNKCVLLYALFSFWCFISIIWASDQSVVLDRAIDLFCNTIFIVVSYDYFMNSEINRRTFIVLFIITGVLFSCYVICYYGLSGYFLRLLSGDRVGSEIINVNFIGFVSSMTFLIIIYSALNGVFKKRYLLYIISIIPLITALGSGSKKVILALLIGMVLIIYEYTKGKVTFKKIITVSLILLTICFSTMIIRNLPYFDRIFDRLDTMISSFSEGSSTLDGSTYKRELYIKEGLKTFLDYPLTGIGLNNSGTITEEVVGKSTYLHCNYVELLACVGLVGFVLYYMIYVLIIAGYFSNKEKYKYKNSLPIILILVMLITEIGSVSYYEIKTSMYLVLMFVLLEKTNWLEPIERNEVCE